ncbi:MAG: TIGR04076 family protein [Deltaproteobacteria bacterium]|nr:TIGR04076 family protein [Deltaproteobacteria bacterium]
MRSLKVTIKEIRGMCSVYEIGDEFLIDRGYVLRTERDLPICMHSLSALMPFYVALSKGVLAENLGLAAEGVPEVALVHCPDPCKSPRGGTVLMEIRPL